MIIGVKNSMAKRKNKNYWIDRARRAERSKRTSQEKLKSYKEGIQEGLRLAKEAQR